MNLKEYKANFIEKVLEDLNKTDAEEIELECIIGCVECCYMPKKIYPHEVDKAKAFLESKRVIVQDLEMIKECAFYAIGCSVYHERPVICRKYKSKPFINDDGVFRDERGYVIYQGNSCQFANYKRFLFNAGHDFKALERMNIESYVYFSNKSIKDLDKGDFKSISAVIVDMAYYLFHFLSENEAPGLNVEELKGLYDKLMQNREENLCCFDEYLSYIETSDYDFGKFSRFFNENFNKPISGTVTVGSTKWEHMNSRSLNYKRDFREINNLLLDQFIVKKGHHQQKVIEFIEADGIDGLIDKYFNEEKEWDEIPEGIKRIIELEFKSIRNSDKTPIKQLKFVKGMIDEANTLKILFNACHDEFDKKVKIANDRIIF